jgi:hypothetical protein
MKSTTNRCNPALSYVIGEIKSMLPKSASANFIVCATGAIRSSASKSFLSALEMVGLPANNLVLLDNSAYETLSEETEADLEGMRDAYEKTKKKLSQIIKIAKNFPPYKSDGIKAIKEKRMSLKNEIHLLMECLNDLTKIKPELIGIKKNIEEAEKDASIECIDK